MQTTLLFFTNNMAVVKITHKHSFTLPLYSGVKLGTGVSLWRGQMTTRVTGKQKLSSWKKSY